MICTILEEFIIIQKYYRLSAYTSEFVLTEVAATGKLVLVQ